MKLELGYDWAFNQTTQDVRQTLKISTANKSGDFHSHGAYTDEGGREEAQKGPGADIFIDSVGGVFHSTVMEQMRSGGRVCILGERKTLHCLHIGKFKQA